MHQNTFGCQAPPGPAAGSYELPVQRSLYWECEFYEFLLFVEFTNFYEFKKNANEYKKIKFAVVKNYR